MEIQIKKAIKAGNSSAVILPKSWLNKEVRIEITKNTDKEMISEGIYNIIIISSELLKQKLKNNLFPVGQMIVEAKPLLNSYYLDSIETKVTKNNIKWYIDTTEEKLKLIKKILNKINKKKRVCVDDKVVYTLVLRIRTLHIIKKLIEKKAYSKREFIRIIKNVSHGKDAYRIYLSVKNNAKKENNLNLEETIKLYEYLRNQLTEVKQLIKNIDKTPQ